MAQSPPACKVRWSAFKAYLANLIQTAQMREQDAFEDLRSLRQGDSETVSELHTRMIGLEADCDPQPEHVRVRTLDAALTNHRTKSQLVSILGGETAPTVMFWLDKALIAEHIAHPRSRRNEKGKHHESGSAPQGPRPLQSSSKERRSRKEKHRKNRENNSGNRSGPSRPNPNSNADITCFTCNQKGHYSGDGKCPKYDEWAKQHPERVRAIESARKEQSQSSRRVNAIQQELRAEALSLKESEKGKAKS
jgi:hypothetical protein